MKVLLPLSLLALLAGIATLALWGGGSGDPDLANLEPGGGRSTQVDSGQPTEVKDDTTPRSTEVAGLTGGDERSTQERVNAALAKIEEANASGQLAVYVVNQKTQTPVSNAQVWLLDRSGPMNLQWQRQMTRTKQRALIQDRGQVQHTDEDGIATFPNVLNGAVLVKAPGLIGERDWRGEIPVPVEILMAEAVELMVEVVDTAGQPVGQVPVAIGQNYPSELRPLQKQRTASPSGIASFRGVTPRLAKDRNNLGYAVGFAFPTSDHQVVPIDPENLPAEPVRLTLPPGSQCLVKVVDEEGELIKDRFNLAFGSTVEIERPNGDDREIFRPIDTRRVSGGVTRLDYLEAGVPITFQLSGMRDRRDMTIEMVGPPAIEGQSEMVLEWTDAYPRVHLQAFSSRNEVLANQAGRAHIEVDGAKRESISIQTDDEGRFSFAIREPWVAPQRRQARMVLFIDGLQYDGLTDLSFDPAPQGSRLGIVVFKERPILATGTVLGAEGPLRGAMVRAQVSTPDGSWSSVSDCIAITGDEGTFELRGTYDLSQQLRLSASAPLHKTWTSDPIGMGTRNLIIQLIEGVDEGNAEAKRRSQKGGEEWRQEQKRAMLAADAESQEERRAERAAAATAARGMSVEEAKRRAREAADGRRGRDG